MRSMYDNTDEVTRAVEAGDHRALIGGLWEEIGKHQFSYLVTHGLKPSSRLIDVGCGCLRGGVHFIPYLNSSCYFGTDVNQSLLQAGYDIEVRALRLEHKLPRDHLVYDAEFEFPGMPTDFDFAIAQSLFTHLPINDIRMCLTRLVHHVRPGGKFFATFFLVDENHPYGTPLAHRGGVTTFDAKDPFHYRFSDISNLCRGLTWRARLHDEWGHPRDQRMVEFRRTPV